MSNDILLRHKIKIDRRERKNVAELRLIINPVEVTDKITDIHLYGKAKKIGKKKKKKTTWEGFHFLYFSVVWKLKSFAWANRHLSRFEGYSAVSITEFLCLFAKPLWCICCSWLLWHRNWATWDNHFRLNGQFQVQDYPVSNEFRPFYILW